MCIRDRLLILISLHAFFKKAKKPPKQEKQHHNQPQEKQSLKRPYKDDQHQQPSNFKKPKKGKR